MNKEVNKHGHSNKNVNTKNLYNTIPEVVEEEIKPNTINEHTIQPSRNKIKSFNKSISLYILFIEQVSQKEFNDSS